MVKMLFRKNRHELCNYIKNIEKLSFKEISIFYHGELKKKKKQYMVLDFL
jgi:hypothetical protein